jgi:hypothetical protein
MAHWGARIRTWDRGTKTRCLTTWLRPTIEGRQFRVLSRPAEELSPHLQILVARAKQKNQGDDSQDPHDDQGQGPDDQHEDRDERDEGLRDGEDPA